MSDTWTPGDRFQLAARGDRFDGTTGRIRRLWTGGDGREHAYVTHDDGTYTSWPTVRLEKPTDPSDGAVTSTPAPSGVPSLVEMDRQEARARVLDAAFIYEDAARGRNVAAEIEARDALLAAVRECRKAVSR